MLSPPPAASRRNGLGHGRPLGAGRSKQVAAGPRQAAGLTLVELLVGVALGLFLMAGAGMMLASHLGDQRRALTDTRITQDLRAAADLVTRDLRRAGYWGSAASTVWSRATAASMAPNPYADLFPAIDGASAAAFGYAYSRDVAEDDSIANAERFGFRLNPDTGAIEMRLSGAAIAPDDDDNWQAITDPGLVRVTEFSVTANNRTLNLISHCVDQACPLGSADCPPRVQVRDYVVRLSGEDPRDATVRRQLDSHVRIRNDRVIGRCPG